MLLMIDNYDSFTYNLVQYLGELGETVKVVRNDALSCDDIAAFQPRAIVLSPGPGTPQDSGICMPAIKRFATQIPILGVCLGHQAIAAAFGAVVGLAKSAMHGKTDLLEHDGSGLFNGLKNPLQVTRYHSLTVFADTLPQDFVVNGKAASDGAVMAMYHRQHCLHSVQFHPESFITEGGKEMLANFLRLAAAR